MNRVFEQVDPLKRVVCRKIFGYEYEPIVMDNSDFKNCSLQTTRSYSQNRATHSMHCCGRLKPFLALNRNKCGRVSLKTVPNTKFSTGEDVPNVDKAEYLGGVINTKAAPSQEVNKRLSGAWYVWEKLKEFWRDGLPAQQTRKDPDL